MSLTKKEQEMPGEIFIDELTDFGGTLAALLSVIVVLIAKHGDDARIVFDAGANNVQAILTPVE